VKTEAEGLAIAKGLEAQQLAIGKEQTMAVNIAQGAGERRTSLHAGKPRADDWRELSNVRDSAAWYPLLCDFYKAASVCP
jgi:hypothetical protein